MSSPIDLLFEDMFGNKPNKDGTAYEILSAAVMKLLEENALVKHDEKLKGTFSNTFYQLDVYIQQETKNEMGEAKDYTKKGSKVGRPDLQKLAGALIDLSEVDGGVFFSATDYTKPAKKYAETSGEFGKEIKLFHLRPSTEFDESGRLMKIIIELEIPIPAYDEAKFAAIFSEEGNAEIERLNSLGYLPRGEMRLNIEEIYDENENISMTISELTKKNLGGGLNYNAQGTFYLRGNFIKVGGHLIELMGIAYDIPILNVCKSIEIHQKGEAKLLLKDEFGHIDKLITDEELKSVIPDFQNK
ncbi:restriction endonuclease [Bacillus toyonensis]|uniref:restriction endonuclease n=1 Tax=Bacillus toyonensis TaxID=155322 RepID=UPI003D233559